MIAKSGDRLIDDEAVGSLKTELLRRAFLVTPNIPEAEALSGIDDPRGRGPARGGATNRGDGRPRVLIKGGHLDRRHRDLLYDGGEFVEFRHRASPAAHARHRVHVCRGDSVSPRVGTTRLRRHSGRRYVAEAIRQRPGLGRGHVAIRDHFWKDRRRGSDRGGHRPMDRREPHPRDWQR